MNPNRPRGEAVLRECPPLRPAAQVASYRIIPDPTGCAVNDLYVMGIRAEHPARWVCRCLCGGYVFRTTGALTGGTAERCDGCKAAAAKGRAA